MELLEIFGRNAWVVSVLLRVRLRRRNVHGLTASSTPWESVHLC